jgi:hypothetical protein
MNIMTYKEFEYYFRKFPWFIQLYVEDVTEKGVVNLHVKVKEEIYVADVLTGLDFQKEMKDLLPYGVEVNLKLYMTPHEKWSTA